jgi:hypothetical protein
LETLLGVFDFGTAGHFGRWKEKHVARRRENSEGRESATADAAIICSIRERTEHRAGGRRRIHFATPCVSRALLFGNTVGKPAD